MLGSGVEQITKLQAEDLIKENFILPNENHFAAGLPEFGAVSKNQILNRLV
jgi:hypothetical protein